MLNKKFFIELCILMNVKNKSDWNSIKQLIDKRISIPYPNSPDEAYGEDVWGFIKDAIRLKKVASYSHSSAIAKKLGIKNEDEWCQFHHQVSMYRIGFPNNPKKEYSSQWKNWDEFLSGY